MLLSFHLCLPSYILFFTWKMVNFQKLRELILPNGFIIHLEGIQSSQCALQGTKTPILPPLTSYYAQPHWFLNTPSKLQPWNRCTCCALCLKYFSFSEPIKRVLYFFPGFCSNIIVLEFFLNHSI